MAPATTSPHRSPRTSMKKRALLLTASGHDAPGITSELTAILAQSKIRIVDIAQAVIQDLLSLSILCELESSEEFEKNLIKDLLFRANELGLKLEFKRVETERTKQKQLPTVLHHYAVTLIGDEVSARVLHRVTGALAESKVNIDVIKRLS